MRKIKLEKVEKCGMLNQSGGDGVKIRIIAAIVLAAMVCGLFWLSMEKREEYQLKLAAYEEAHEKMEQQALVVQQLQARLDALTTDKADELAGDAQAMAQEADRLEKEMQELQTQIDTLKESLDNLGADALSKQEEIDYLEQVYQALQEGYEKVKGYIAGN
jgi:uncharacterized coiled-coil DUF342 family protein